MRNWWIELEVDGRAHKLSVGPNETGGGFTLKVYQRSRAKGIEAFQIHGVCNGSELLLHGVDRNGAEVEVVTER